MAIRRRLIGRWDYEADEQMNWKKRERRASHRRRRNPSADSALGVADGS